VCGAGLGRKAEVAALRRQRGAIRTLELALAGESYRWVADAIAYLNSPAFKAKFQQLRDASTDTLAGLFRGQEMLMLNTALPHRDD